MSKISLQKAVDIAGGQVALASAIRRRVSFGKISQAHIWKWLNRVAGEVPPADYVLAICDSVDWQVTPHELRPDVYPNPTDGLPQETPVVRAKEKEAA